ncbi:hypothetical protein Tco_1563522 [Tanacetum coccineum]
MVKKSKLDEDPQEKAVDPTRYRGMIGTLMYLTANRPGLVFVVCMCAFVARDEKWVPFTKRVKISSTNVRLETIVPQKEETFQVVIDLIKNSSCFKAFTISADVPEIFMQQFWYSTKKVQGTYSYEFLLANKKCVVNANVFRMILDICPRVKGENFTNVPDDDATLAFLIKLGYKEDVDYPELIWEDLAFQIDHRKEKRSRRENMSFSQFTKIIINHFPKQHKSLSNLKYQHYHIIKDDCIVSRLKFVRIGEDYQKYRRAIPKVMLNDAIKQSESYQMFIKYSTESEPKPEPVKRKTASRRVVKKKVTFFVNDNIITDDPDVALELGKSISLTEAEEAKAARSPMTTHARLFTDSLKRSRSKNSVIVAYIMQALKESKKTSKRQPGTGGSNEGTGTIPEVSDESTIVSPTSSEGTGTKLGVPDEENDITEENICVLKDEDEEMLNAKVEYSEKGDAKVSNAAKADAEKTEEVKDDSKKAELPPTSSSLSISSGFGDQFLKLSSDTSLVSTVKDTTYVDINSLLEFSHQYKNLLFFPKIAIVTTLPPLFVSTTPPIPQQTTTPIPTPPITTDALTITTVVSESDALSAIYLRVAKLEKEVSELKKIDLSVEALAALKTQVPYFQIPELPKNQTPTFDLEQKSEKSPLEILKIKKEQAEKQKMLKFTIKSIDKAALKEFDQKSTLYQTMHANKSFNKNPANHRLYHAHMEALIEDENVMERWSC